MKDQNFILLGLPGSGKTTFLAAFWAILSNGSGSGEIEIGKLTGDLRYLNRISQAWLRYDEMERTLPTDETSLTIPLQVRADRQGFILHVPELAGENYKKAWETRALPQKVADFLEQADGLVLFISSRHVDKPVRMDQARAALFNLAPEAFAEPAEDQDDERPAPEPEPWRHEMAPTQVILVDLLQFAEELRVLRRLSIIVSAWDAVRKDNPTDTPETWFHRELPLLRQYLQRNPGQIETRVFGVSAQGGDYKHDFGHLSELPPALRPKVFDGKGNELNELIAPLKWLPI